MRAVTAFSLETSLCQMIVDISNDVGGPLKAWACYLRWLHTHCSPEQELSVEALALIEQQIADLPLSDVPFESWKSWLKVNRSF
jgi:hypothetical protein